MNTKNTGRPVERRQKIAGKQLGIALKILGKTWRKDTKSKNHVHNWKKWTDLKLPKSATTIDKDIKDGIPDSRVTAYAHCLGVQPKILLAEQQDFYKTLFPEESTPGRNSSDNLGFLTYFSDHYNEHNSNTYINELSALLQGVYRMHYVLQGVESIHRCAVWIQAAENNHLIGKARFVMFGIENLANVNIFCWHNNLHFHYLCENRLELGYLMTVDPLRHNIVRQRTPFWLKGQGLTDRGSSQNPPITLSFIKKKLMNPEKLPLEDLWQQECENMRSFPHIMNDSPQYATIHDEILAPDNLDLG